MAKSVSQSPTNLKEAIDWILQVTGRCDQGSLAKTGSDGTKELATAVKKIFEVELGAGDKSVLAEVIRELGKDSSIAGPDNLIKQLADKLASFVGYKNGKTDGKTGIAAQGYSSSYNPDSVKWNETNKQLYAKIFLGCIPLIFSALSYLYWQCNKSDKKNGKTAWVNRGPTGAWEQRADPRWTTQKINNTDSALGVFMVSMGYSKDQLASCSGTQVKGFLDGSTAFHEFSLTKGAKVAGLYSPYLQKLFASSKNNVKQYPLSQLYLASQYYFRKLQRRRYLTHHGKPCTIREMLYWLMALPYTTVFASLNKDTFFAGKDKSIQFVRGPNTHNDVIKFSSPKWYVLPPCFYSAFVLLTLESQLNGNNRSATHNNTLLYDIYINTEFGFCYPDNASEWFSMLWDVVYTLTLQLNFVKLKCRTNFSTGSGWEDCKYGRSIKYDGINSWICTTAAQHVTQSTSPHKCSTGCKTHSDLCGQNGKPSPLQAFLCDELKGFKCEHPESKTSSIPLPYNSHANHMSNRSQWCPVPMGFASHLKYSRRDGFDLFYMLEYYTDDNVAYPSLYSLVLCLLCVTTRTPRTLGSLFGFFRSLAAAYTTSVSYVTKTTSGISGGSTNLKTALQNEVNGYPGAHNGDIVTFVEQLSGNDNSHTIDHVCDLHSLHECEKHSCGKYLLPLCSSVDYLSCVEFVNVYLSWIVYLTEEFRGAMRVFLEAFYNINCKEYGCKNCTNAVKCHGSGIKCSCRTVVQCAAVLPLLYRFGFTYHSPTSLNSTTGTKRECFQFAEQLQKVVNSAFTKVINAINTFLLSIREPFLLYLLTFWLLVMAYLTCGMALPLDLLHIRSHWKQPSTHLALPIILFTQKTMEPCHLWYFKP
ncbi:uncharacterized protein BXIN_1485 [Babesia sp. Xinjiang]|uniref:uncharacterized protein n=1 Tax=Babesia sp. Xinjiang TaxID=462227 RepID=UPI000A23CABC|nr:uncharacterized protein BXIN_1485 [Babesia sp. Xinjiang]ORM42260.1 hypothetical protein BXIN_1485 [Babesia sp. Xinjiang]